MRPLLTRERHQLFVASSREGVNWTGLKTGCATNASVVREALWAVVAAEMDLVSIASFGWSLRVMDV